METTKKVLAKLSITYNKEIKNEIKKEKNPFSYKTKMFLLLFFFNGLILFTKRIKVKLAKKKSKQRKIYMRV